MDCSTGEGEKVKSMRIWIKKEKGRKERKRNIIKNTPGSEITESSVYQ
jgi:hypothetical protein